MIRPNFLKILHHLLVKRMGRDRGTVPDDDQLAFGAGEGHIHTAGISEKAYFTFAVRAHEADDDGFFLAALETVHAVDLYFGMLDLASKQFHLR